MRRIRSRRRRWALALALGCALAVAGSELAYVNWQPAAPPVETQPLVIRRDTKGDGRFLSPRSGARLHLGVDLAAPLESPVHAIRSGRVVEVGLHRGLGRFVKLAHRGRLRSLYAHLNTVSVRPGARIRQGAVIGTVGKTGNAQHRWITPHVHLEVWRDGEPVDPQTLGLEVEHAQEPGDARESG